MSTKNELYQKCPNCGALNSTTFAGGFLGMNKRWKDIRCSKCHQEIVFRDLSSIVCTNCDELVILDKNGRCPKCGQQVFGGDETREVICPDCENRQTIFRSRTGKCTCPICGRVYDIPPIEDKPVIKDKVQLVQLFTADKLRAAGLLVQRFSGPVFTENTRIVVQPGTSAVVCLSGGQMVTLEAGIYGLQSLLQSPDGRQPSDQDYQAVNIYLVRKDLPDVTVGVDPMNLLDGEGDHCCTVMAHATIRYQVQNDGTNLFVKGFGYENGLDESICEFDPNQNRKGALWNVTREIANSKLIGCINEVTAEKQVSPLDWIPRQNGQGIGFVTIASVQADCMRLVKEKLHSAIKAETVPNYGLDIDIQNLELTLTAAETQLSKNKKIISGWAQKPYSFDDSITVHLKDKNDLTAFWHMKVDLRMGTNDRAKFFGLPDIRALVEGTNTKGIVNEVGLALNDPILALPRGIIKNRAAVAAQKLIDEKNMDVAKLGDPAVAFKDEVERILAKGLADYGLKTSVVDVVFDGYTENDALKRYRLVVDLLAGKEYTFDEVITVCMPREGGQKADWAAKVTLRMGIADEDKFFRTPEIKALLSDHHGSDQGIIPEKENAVQKIAHSYFSQYAKNIAQQLINDQKQDVSKLGGLADDFRSGMQDKLDNKLALNGLTLTSMSVVFGGYTENDALRRLRIVHRWAEQAYSAKKSVTVHMPGENEQQAVWPVDVTIRAAITDINSFFHTPEVRNVFDGYSFKGSTDAALMTMGEENPVSKIVYNIFEKNADTVAQKLIDKEKLDAGKLNDLTDAFCDGMKAILERDLSACGLSPNLVSIRFGEHTENEALKEVRRKAEWDKGEEDRKNEILAAVRKPISWVAAAIPVHQKGEPLMKADIGFTGTCMVDVVNRDTFFVEPEARQWVKKGFNEEAVRGWCAGIIRDQIYPHLASNLQQLIDARDVHTAEIVHHNQDLLSVIRGRLNETVGHWGIQVQSLSIDAPTVKLGTVLQKKTDFDMDEYLKNLDIKAIDSDTALADKKAEAARKAAERDAKSRIAQIEALRLIDEATSQSTLAAIQRDLDEKLKANERAEVLRKQVETYDNDRAIRLQKCQDELAELKQQARFDAAALMQKFGIETRKVQTYADADILNYISDNKIERRKIEQMAQIAYDAADRRANATAQDEALDAQLAANLRAKKNDLALDVVALEMDMNREEFQKRVNDIRRAIDDSNLEMKKKMDAYHRLMGQLDVEDAANRVMRTAEAQANADVAKGKASLEVGKLMNELDTLKEDLSLMKALNGVKLTEAQKELVEKIDKYAEERQRRKNADQDARDQADYERAAETQIRLYEQQKETDERKWQQSRENLDYQKQLIEMAYDMKLKEQDQKDAMREKELAHDALLLQRKQEHEKDLKALETDLEKVKEQAKQQIAHDNAEFNAAITNMQQNLIAFSAKLDQQNKHDALEFGYLAKKSEADSDTAKAQYTSNADIEKAKAEAEKASAEARAKMAEDYNKAVQDMISKTQALQNELDKANIGLQANRDNKNAEVSIAQAVSNANVKDMLNGMEKSLGDKIDNAQQTQIISHLQQIVQQLATRVGQEARSEADKKKNENSDANEIKKLFGKIEETLGEINKKLGNVTKAVNARRCSMCQRELKEGEYQVIEGQLLCDHCIFKEAVKRNIFTQQGKNPYDNNGNNGYQ